MTVSNPAPTITAPTVSARVGGIEFAFTRPTDLDYEGLKIYGSTSTGFTADSSTLLVDTKETTVLVTGLTAGALYYYKYVPYDIFGDGSLSSEGSVTTLQNSFAGTIDTLTGRENSKDGRTLYAETFASLGYGNYTVAGSVNMTIGSVDSTDLPLYWGQICKAGFFDYTAVVALPFDVELTNIGPSEVDQKSFVQRTSAGDMTAYVSVGDIITLEADGINSVWCVVTEVIDDEYVRVTNRFNATPSIDYWGSSSASLNEPVASSSAVVFQGAGDVVYTTFSAKSWLNFATTNDYDVDASGAFSLEVDDLNYITRPYIHIFIEGPYINDSASENIAENISASYQFVYKG